MRLSWKNEATNRQAKTSTNMKKRRKKTKTHSPQLQALLYFAFKSHSYKLPRIKLTIK